MWEVRGGHLGRLTACKAWKAMLCKSRQRPEHYINRMYRMHRTVRVGVTVLAVAARVVTRCSRA